MRLSEIATVSDAEMSPDLVRRDMNSIRKGDEWMTIDDVVLYKKRMSIGIIKRPIDGVIFMHGGKKIGYAQLGTRRLWNSEEREVIDQPTEVASIGLLPEWQRRGIGKKFYERLLDLGPLCASGAQTSGGQTIWQWLLSRTDLDFRYFAPATTDSSGPTVKRIPSIWKPYEGETLWGPGVRPSATIVASKR